MKIDKTIIVICFPWISWKNWRRRAWRISRGSTKSS